MHTANTMCLQSFWALLCICVCLPSDVNAKKACDRRPWIPLAKYCPLWLQPFHLQLHFSDGRFFSPSWLPSHAWAIGCRSLNNLQSWRLPCENFRFTSFTSTIISWYHDRYSMHLHATPFIYNIYIYHIYKPKKSSVFPLSQRLPDKNHQESEGTSQASILLSQVSLASAKALEDARRACTCGTGDWDVGS